MLDAGPAPAVDGLVVVADREYLRATTGQQPQPGVLEPVGVLELVHQQMAEPGAVMLQQLGVRQQQLLGAQQDLGEIHQAAAATELVVGGIDLDLQAQGRIPVVFDGGCAQALVLAAVDEPLQLLRRPALLVEAHGPHHPPDDAQLVVGVDDLEVLRQSGLLPVGAQHAMRQAVEGADPHAARRYPEQALDPAPHLAGGLVGEGHGQQAEGRDALDLHQPGEPVHQHPGLAGTGAGEHQQVPGRRGHGLALGGIEPVEQAGDVVVHPVHQSEDTRTWEGGAPRAIRCRRLWASSSGVPATWMSKPRRL